MKSLHRILKCQSHFLKAIIFTFLISANASLIPLSAEEFMEPGYHCNKKIYSFRVIEETREAACHGLISIYETARRPRVYIHNNNFEDYIYEWSIPVSKSRDSEGSKRRFIEKISFDNRCELKDVLYYNGSTYQYEPCKKVPDVSTSTSSEVEKVPADSLVHCGSLSWKIEEIQLGTNSHLSKFLKGRFEVKNTSSLADGPWLRSILRKRITIRKITQLVPYEVIVNNQNEVRGVIVTHHISNKETTAHDSNQTQSDLLTPISTWKKDEIRLVCLFDKTFPLLSPALISNSSSQRKRKTRE
ncbi:hypothetical protein BGT96224_Ac31542 [Blumeria graminis f. sp. tritici 96224]|uniref:Uncharacterized protein n=1 Tax=Blumeria graminis f. sp. tritici 96224 TaxID=1268274 RepID=A0A656KNA9_BLUGR|nr:hypothetical protein BGT96224_Ac31542 [Blumeria graminis f. sp. tritici 96224]